MPTSVTIRDVAEAAGVSVATASRALSGRRRVSPSSARAVQRASEQLGYRANTVARSLRMRSTQTVGMVVPGISNPFFPATVETLEPLLSAQGRELFLCDSQDSVSVESARLNALLDRKVDGLIIVPCHRSDSAEAVAAAAERIPVLQLDRYVEGFAGDYVGADHHAGVVAIVDQLWRLGCERLAFVSAEERTSSAQLRLEAFKRATAERRLEDTGTYLGEFSLEWGRAAATRILRRRPLPDAIVCGADVLAFGVIAALTADGVRIPEDVSVTGFDDISFAEICRPSLTTVRQPVAEIAAEGARLLQHRLAGEGGSPQHRVLQPKVVVRDSTWAPPPSGPPASDS
jgi:LacI family transcriptional regulator